jgi:broad specificity phosphatase PhoE
MKKGLIPRVASGVILCIFVIPYVTLALIHSTGCKESRRQRPHTAFKHHSTPTENSPHFEFSAKPVPSLESRSNSPLPLQNETTMSMSSIASTTTTTTDSHDSLAVQPKSLWGVRHGTSVSNEWMEEPLNTWGAPTFCDDAIWRDARLSPTVGHEQMKALVEQLCNQQQQQLHSSDVTGGTLDCDVNTNNIVDIHLDLRTIDCIVVSPLTRCLETLDCGIRPAFQQCHIPLPPCIALPLATERVYTIADHGRSLSTLQAEFPYVDFTEAYEYANEEGEDWWWDLRTRKGSDNHDVDDTDHVEWRPHGQGQWYAVPGEPANVFAQRMAHLQAWLAQRPERTLLMVTHWGVLMHWLQQYHHDSQSTRNESKSNESHDIVKVEEEQLLDIPNGCVMRLSWPIHSNESLRDA